MKVRLLPSWESRNEWEGYTKPVHVQHEENPMEINMHLIFTIILLIHGIGHILGVLSIVAGLIKHPSYTPKSWLLSDRLGLSDTVVRALGMLWFVVMVGFIAAAWGFWSELAWWRPLSWGMVVLSIGVFVLWWNAFAANIPIQGNIGNIIIIAGLLGVFSV
jgi:hypothetical protein